MNYKFSVVYFCLVLTNLLCFLKPSKASSDRLLEQAFYIPQPTNLSDIVYLGKSIIC
jgi:hypothetical protein